MRNNRDKAPSDDRRNFLRLATASAGALLLSGALPNAGAGKLTIVGGIYRLHSGAVELIA